MPTLERTCFVCDRPVTLAGQSLGPIAIWAGAHGRVLCTACAQAAGIDRSDPHRPRVHWPDGDRFSLVAGQFVGNPDFNPDSPHYDPPEATLAETPTGHH